jgi:hypothetical protein
MSADALATLRRQRAVLSTVADAIVAAARGRSLRVAVHGDHRYDDAFADRLTQALLARGRDCRCPSTVRGVAPAPDRTSAEDPAGARRTIVIVCGPARPGDTDVCRIDIQVNTVTPLGGPRGVAGGLDADAGDSGQSGGNRDSDIVVDYLDPNGPIVSHLASWLAPQARR